MSSLMKWKSAGLLLDRAAAAYLKVNRHVYDCQQRWSTHYYDSTDDGNRPSAFSFSQSQQELAKFLSETNHSGLNVSVINAGEIKLNPNTEEFVPLSKQCHDRKKLQILDPNAKEFNPQSKQRHALLKIHKSQSLNLNPRAHEFIPQSKQSHDHSETHERNRPILDPSAKEFNPQSKQRHHIFMIQKSSSLNLNPRAYEFIPQLKKCHDYSESNGKKPLILDPSVKEFNPQSKQRNDIFVIHKSSSLNLNPRAHEFIPQLKKCHDYSESNRRKALILDPSVEFNPQSKQKHDIFMIQNSQSLNLNPRAYEFILQLKKCHDYSESKGKKPLILDPSVKEFNPQSKLRHDILRTHKSQFMNLNPRADEFIPLSKQRNLDLESTLLSANPKESFHHLHRNNNMGAGKTFLMRLEECIEQVTEEDMESYDYLHQDQQPIEFQTLNPFASPFKPLVVIATLSSEANIQNDDKSPESRPSRFRPLNPFANPFVSLNKDDSPSSSNIQKTQDNLQQIHSGAEVLRSTLKELLRKRPISFKFVPTECAGKSCAITENFVKDNSQEDGFSTKSNLCECLNPSAKEFFPQSRNYSTGASSLGDTLHNIEYTRAVSNANNSTAKHETLNPKAQPFISQLKIFWEVSHQTDSLSLNKREPSATSVQHHETETESISTTRELKQGKLQLSAIAKSSPQRESVLNRDANIYSSVYAKDNTSTLNSTTSVIATAPTISESINQSFINEDTPKRDFRRTPRRQYQGPPRREFADDLPEINGPYSPSQYECLRILHNLPFLKHDEILGTPKQWFNVPNEGQNLQERPENGQQVDMCFVEKHPLRFPDFFF